MTTIQQATETVRSGQDLGMTEMTELIGLVMEGECAEDDIVALLVALHEKGEAVEEVAGAAIAMRSKMVKIQCPHERFIDVVGTGGDGSSTFNISTASALVAAAAGVPVAKHGNRGFTSKSGSADVLAKLGVNIEADVATVETCLAELGLCFCFAPLMHGAMKHVGPARRKISTPTIFNILGPLANPAEAPFQLLGVGRAHQQHLLAEAVLRLPTQRVAVTLAAPTKVIEASGGKLHETEWTPELFGLPQRERKTMIVDSPDASAAIILDILDGEEGPCRDIVVANAAAAVWTVLTDKGVSLKECAARVADAIDSGDAKRLLKRLAECSHG
jgi:anthranilate phosphoribosyltransferase